MQLNLSLLTAILATSTSVLAAPNPISSQKIVAVVKSLKLASENSDPRVKSSDSPIAAGQKKEVLKYTPFTDPIVAILRAGEGITDILFFGLVGYVPTGADDIPKSALCRSTRLSNE
ncbi:hypothetical protein N7492_003405 [Penicillium capsulatum]|uniref:Uncharacterized protein n=1 Tax=Penicillium capsulatum TaxID=69766 RepID=A0A9W9INK9_9EURO|nr:hypothetical protein N7492_003405 [Penicillium capsulatum]KAJ6122012.1 hypothetical protein N7512_004477 [Penicillium capsulatum]